MSHRQRNRKRNKHEIRHWWRGDIEGTVTRRFPTAEDAWAYVLGKIRATIRGFDEYCDAPECSKKTVVDYEKLKTTLLEKGRIGVVYCQTESWWHTLDYNKLK